MRILLLCEGDAETRDSWSGVSLSVVEHLRAAGHTVIPGDVDLYGLPRLLLALRTFAPRRKRWWVRYHLHGAAFRARSRNAARLRRQRGGDADLILQIGATFQVEPGDLPLVLYCDSNIEMSRSASPSGHSEAAVLTGRELDEIRDREAAVYRGARLIFTMSEVLRRSFMEAFRIPADRLVTIHCGPNVQVPGAPPPPQDGGSATVLFVGRDFARKGGDLLMRAFPEVRRRVPAARLLVVGHEFAGECPEWAEFMPFQSRDTPHGAAAIDRAFRGATAFCLPTRFEPFGTSFVEAMLYGLPCVGPRVWAVPEIIVDGQTGILVTPEDPDALADALARLLEAPTLAWRMGQEGRRRAIEAFSWVGVTDRMIRNMEAMLRGEAYGEDDEAHLAAS
jgi:glycosyltransferase involved in cell wall biosynthesis